MFTIIFFWKNKSLKILWGQHLQLIKKQAFKISLLWKEFSFFLNLKTEIVLTTTTQPQLIKKTDWSFKLCKWLIDPSKDWIYLFNKSHWCSFWSAVLLCSSVDKNYDENVCLQLELQELLCWLKQHRSAIAPHIDHWALATPWPLLRFFFFIIFFLRLFWLVLKTADREIPKEALLWKLTVVNIGVWHLAALNSDLHANDSIFLFTCQ